MAQGKHEISSFYSHNPNLQNRGKCDTKRRRRNAEKDDSLDELEATLDKEYNETLADMAAESERVRSGNYISPVWLSTLSFSYRLLIQH